MTVGVHCSPSFPFVPFRLLLTPTKVGPPRFDRENWVHLENRLFLCKINVALLVFLGQNVNIRIQMDKLEEVKAAIPHREPFLFVDEIVECEENRILCKKTFHADDYFFAGHYPGNPIVPGVLQCEAAMQAGAILLTRIFKDEAVANRLPVVAKLEKVRFREVVRPGDEMMIISREGIIIRVEVDGISEQGRYAQGVRVIKLGEGDAVVDMAKVIAREDEEEEE